MTINRIKRPISKPAAMAAMGLALALLVACADAKPRQFSGFLGDYSALKKVPGAQADFVYRKPGANLANYDSIMFDPVAIYYHPLSQLQAMDPRDIARLAVIFQNALTDTIRDTYPVALRPGPKTLRVRGAIANLILFNPFPSIASTAVMKFSLSTRKAYIEAEFLDSITNERLVAIVAVKGEDGNTKPQALTHWSQVEGAFRLWAWQFRARLDFLHGKK